GPLGTDTTGLPEWDLDSQSSTGMAPEAAGFTFYFGTASSFADVQSATQRWADDPSGSAQLSMSLGICEDAVALGLIGGDIASLDRTFQQAQMEGRTVFVASGDDGGQCIGAQNGLPGALPGVDYPASSPYVVGVGGTVMPTTTGSDGKPARDTEYAWTSSGGGLSHMEPAPPWQGVHT